MQGPDPYLRELGIVLPCAVRPEQEAVLDEDHRVFVNLETFFVSDLEALAAFEHTPTAYFVSLTDPVTGERFVPAEGSPRRDRGGRVFLFASGETASRFDADPAAYESPAFGRAPSSE